MSLKISWQDILWIFFWLGSKGRVWRLLHTCLTALANCENTTTRSFRHLTFTYQKSDTIYSLFISYNSRRVFFCVYIASSSARGGFGEFERVMQTPNAVKDLHNLREFPHTPSIRQGFVNTRKVLYCLHKIFFKNACESIKRRSWVYVNTYRPISTRVVSH